MKSHYARISPRPFCLTRLIVLLFAGLSQSAIAASYYVSTSGSDTNPGTEASPWSSATKVYNTAQAGDTAYFKNTDAWASASLPMIQVKGGVTYDGSSWGGGTRATLRATANLPGDNPTPIVYFQADHASYQTVVTGFDIDGFNKTVNGVGVNWPSSQGNLIGAVKRIENCVIHDLAGLNKDSFGIYGIKVGAVGSYATRDVEVLGNIVHNIARGGIVLYDALTSGSHYIENVIARGNTVYNAGADPLVVGEGILVKDDIRNAIVEYNYLHSNDGRGISVACASGRPGPTNAIIRHNIVYNNSLGGISLVQPGSRSVDIYGNLIFQNLDEGSGGTGIYFENNLTGNIATRIYNNTIYSNAAGGIHINSPNANFTTLEIKNNIIYPATPFAISDPYGKIPAGSNTNNITSAPGYKNTSNLPTGFIGIFDVDLRPNNDGLSILSGGAAIDYGANLGTSYIMAINSVTRAAPWDAGAYEFALTTPSAPSGLSATAISSDQINLAWTDNSSNETGFEIERKTGAGGTYAQIDTTSANVTSYPNTGLAAGTTYFYRLNATNAYGDSGYSNEASATTSTGSSLVAHWMFDEGSGTTASDSSGNGNTGTLQNGPTWTTGQIGGALNLDGVDDLVNAGSAGMLDNVSAITVAAWVNPGSTGEGGYGRIVQKGSTSNPTAGFRFLTQGTNQLGFAVDYGTTDLNRVSATNTVTMGAWSHVVATWDGSTSASNVHIYVNGVEVSSYATTTNPAGARGDDNAASLYIGGNDTIDRTFAGKLDDVRVYNSVLSASDVLALYQASDTTPPTVSLTAPADGAFIRATAAVTANASDPGGLGVVGVQFKLDGANLGAEDTASPYSINWDTTTASNGSHTLTAVARDGANNTTTSTAIIVTVDNAAPTVSITSPAGGTVSGTINVDASAADTGGSGLVGVQFKLDGANLGAEDTASPYGINWDTTTASNGSHALTAVARDAAGNTTTSTTVNVTVSNLPAAPSGLGATPISYNQINLAWTDNSSNETGFKIERKKGAGGTYTQIGTAGANATSYNDTTAGAGTAYTYRVRANNGSGDSAYSNEASATSSEITAGRQGHWKLDEGAGTSAADSSGNGNTGTLQNSPGWVAGQIGNGLNFDGIDDLVTAGSGATLDNLPALTVAAWIKPDSAGEGSAGRIVQKGAGSQPTTGGFWFHLDSSNQLVLAVDYATTNMYRISAASGITYGAWTHVVVTWTGSATATNIKFYVNGVETSYNATAPNGVGTRVNDGATSFTIGNESGGTRTFDGALDDVRVYNRVLSASEITAVHNAGGL